MRQRSWSSLRIQLILSTSLLVIAALTTTQVLGLSQARDVYLAGVLRDMEFMADQMLRPVDAIAATSRNAQEFAPKVAAEVDYIRDQYFAKHGMKGYAFVLAKDGTTIYSLGTTSGNVNDLGEQGKIQMAKMKDVNFNGTVYYTWKNPSDPAPREKVAVVRTIPSKPDWILAISAYTSDDLLVPFTSMAKRTYMLGGLVLVVAILMVLVLANRIVRALTPLQASMAQIAAGDLQFDLSPLAPVMRRKDELGSMAREFSGMVSGLRDMLRGIHVQTEAVGTAAARLATVSNHTATATHAVTTGISAVSAGTLEQSQYASEIHRTIQELEQIIDQVAQGNNRAAVDVQTSAGMLHGMVNDLEAVSQNAAGVADGSSRVAEMARSGVKVVDDTMQGMEQIHRVVGDAGEHIQDLARLSSQIGAITGVITEIAEQTNLLALNAAIEAARAGEHGRGFAVVAEEVRKLAERSARSSGEINQLIATIQARTLEVVTAVQSGMTEVEAGSRLASETQRFLREIVSTVEQSASDISTIAEAAGRVQKEAAQIVQAFEAVGAMTEENSAATEEMSAGAVQVTSSIDRIVSISHAAATSAKEVTASSQEIAVSSDEVAAAARDLQRIAGDLAAGMQRFRL